MATRSNTVEMVLRARDEMSMTYQEIIKFTDQLSKAQERLEGNFGRSAKESEELTKALEKVGNAGKSVDQAAKAMDEFSRKSAQLEQTAREAEQLRTALEAVAQAAKESQQGTVDPSVAQHYKALSQAAQDTTTRIGELEQKLRDLNDTARQDALAKNQQALDRAAQQQQKLTDAYDRQKTNLQALIDAERQRAQVNLSRSVSQVETLTQKYHEQLRRVQELSQARGRDGEMTATQATRYTAAQAQLDKYGEALRRAHDGARQAAEAQRALNDNASSHDKIGRQAEKLRELGERAKQSTQEVDRLSAGLNDVTISDRTAASISKLGTEIDDLKQHYSVLSHEADKARRAMQNSVGPVDPALGNELARLERELGKTEGKLKTQTTALKAMDDSLRAAGVDTANLAGSQERLAQSAARLANAKRQQAEASRRAAENTRLFNDETRKSLGAVQRLRGEVLSLVTAYMGLYGIARQVSDVFQSAIALQQTEIRFRVAFDGDIGKVRDEMHFIRAEADRLKLSFLDVGDAYSQFVAAIPPGLYEVQEMRDIFTGFGTASRVLGLSNERIKLSFLAIQQMMSKGTVMMEELKRQLGDSLPGAVNIFAEAMGYSADELGEFFKAVEQGQVLASEAVPKAAALLQEKYGRELPAALQTGAAALAGFENAVAKVNIAVAGSGFLDTLTATLNTLSDTITDPAFQASLVDFADLIGSLLSVAVQLVPHMEMLVYLFGVFLGIGLLRYLSRTVSSLINFVKHSRLLTNQLKLLIPEVRKLGGALRLLGAIGIGTWGLAQITELISAHREVQRIHDETVRKITALDRDIAARQHQQGDSLFGNLRKQSLADLEMLRNNARDTLSDLYQREIMMHQANDRVGWWDFRGPDFDDGQFEDVARHINEARGALQMFSAELQRRRPAGLEQTSQLIQNTADNVRAYTQAIRDMEDAQLDSIIEDLNRSFAASQEALGDAERNSKAFVELERERVEAILALERYRRQRSEQIAAMEIRDRLAVLAQGSHEEGKLLEEQRKLVSEMAEHRISETRRSMDAITSELDNARRAEKQYAQIVKDLTRGIADERDRQSSVSRGFSREGMSEINAYYDRRRELMELHYQTEQALEEGNFQKAEELARKREQMALELSRVNIQDERTGRVLESQERARLRSAGALREAHDQINRAMEGQREQAEAAEQAQQDLVQNLTDHLGTLNETLRDLQSDQIKINAAINMDELRDQFQLINGYAAGNPVDLAINLDDRIARLQLAELIKPTESVHTIRLEVDTSGVPQAILRSTGGLAELPAFATGGLNGTVRGPGTGTSDDILAWLSNGEYVVREKVVRKLGTGFFDHLNRHGEVPQIKLDARKLLPRYAMGGPVMNASQYTPAADTGTGDRVTLDLNINGKQIGELEGPRDVVDSLINTLKGELR